MKNIANENFNKLVQLRDFEQTAKWLSIRGWSEGAGGNMSVRLDGAGIVAKGEPIALPITVPHLAGMALLLTGSGTRAREIHLQVTNDVGLYLINSSGTAYSWVAGNNRPSCELPAHCAIHNVLSECRPEDKAVMHTHPAKLIALSHLPELANGAAISDKILRLQSEALLHFPEGIGYVPHQHPGSLALGLASAELVKRHSLILWHMHGCLAVGKDLSTAFDYMEYFEKCARIYWTLRSAGIDPVGMKDEDIEKTLKAFGQFHRYNSP